MILVLKIILTCLKILKVSVNLTCTTEWRFALVCPRDLSALASVEAVNVVLRFCRTLMHLSPVHSGQ
ncbi:Proteasome maturation factor UMP1 [Zea mays]|uniref:Proteasome maturation factor UMP1 n=1 Tax=Zea mays TaxID=4577 RepID=A0A1D6HNK1_MAIZE|nr:Proteasome maturation factor UMP1 [Zea mays]